MLGNDATLDELASQVAARLFERGQRLVLAESCTAGLIAATLAKVPGISAHFCGSSVVYRERTKTQWLGVTAATLARWSAVSERVTAELTQGVLQRTDEATVALGITGHLGPQAPPDLDGQVFMAIWARERAGLVEVAAVKETLVATRRVDRQRESVGRALMLLKNCIK